jgi:hypothetical protein
MSEAVSLAPATILPSVVFGAFVFLWHLWLAPYELAIETANNAVLEAKEAAQKAQRPPLDSFAKAPPPQEKKKLYDFNPLRLRSSWDVGDIAVALAAVSTGGTDISAAYAYRDTVKDAMNTGALKYIRTTNHRIQGGYNPPSGDTKAKKPDVIAWAESVGFDMSKLK